MLIVLRGNSGSGKSTVARLLQDELGWPTALLAQDYFRRVVFREREQEHLEHAALLEASAAHCLKRRENVIVEGILHAGRYGRMLERLAALADDARFFAFDLSFEETVRRHSTRAESADFGVEDMRSWYHGWQPLDFVDEGRITAQDTAEDVVKRILADPA